jgi:FlaA1/EpsC-like NDP-sugar epimerase
MSIIEALKVALVNLIGAALIAIFWLAGAISLSLAGILVYFVIYLSAAELYRFSYRAFYVIRKLLGLYGGVNPPKHVLVISNMDMAGLIIRRLLQGEQMGFKPVAVLTDDAGIEEKLLGVRVYNGTTDFRTLLANHAVGEIVLLAGYYGSKRTNELKAVCDSLNIEIKVFEGLHPIAGEGERLFRKLNLEDLLKRDEIKFEQTWIESFITGKNVLVTGAAGSIGSEICRQCILYGCSNLYALDMDENGLFKLEYELCSLPGGTAITPILASIRDAERVDSIFAALKPDVCFHAAAHKHVPMMEDNPCEAIKNNIFGTMNVLKACDSHGVKKLIMISTDKAVNPSSVMGATKRVAEMIVQEYGKTATTEVAAVRFGNVLGSNGSVVPLFQKQIENGGPVTVTHPDVERYFMTIPEAVRLVLHAGALAHRGEIFMLDMGNSVKILDLAKTLIRLAGLEPGKDIEIKITGLRPGEKLFEELRMESECMDTTSHKSISICIPINIDRVWLDSHLYELRKAVMTEDEQASLDGLFKLTPSIYRKPTIHFNSDDDTDDVDGIDDANDMDDDIAEGTV